MFCSNCGNTIAPGSAFCSKCGTPLGNGTQVMAKDAEMSIGGNYLRVSGRRFLGSYYKTRGALFAASVDVDIPLTKIDSIGVKEKSWSLLELIVIVLFCFLTAFLFVILLAASMTYMGRFCIVIKQRDAKDIQIPLLRGEVEKARVFVRDVESAIRVARYSASNVSRRKVRHSYNDIHRSHVSEKKTSDGRFILD